MNLDNKIYLDYSATTPLAPEALESMLPYFSNAFGNASSIHSFGQEAKVAMEDSRRKIAQLLNAEIGEIVFTAGGTEANNWALKGAASFYTGQKRHIITTNAEHYAVLNTCQSLEKIGCEVTYLNVDETGMISAQKVAEAMREDTFLVSAMHVNNEIGTINPVGEIGRLCRERDVLFHTDAVQSTGKLPIDVKKMNIDLLTLSGHKFYGPKGIGALYIRQGIKLGKLLHGGKHERDRRAGTENVPAIVGLGKAAEICSDRMETDFQHFSEYYKALKGKIMSVIPDTKINGHPDKFYPGILNVSFEGIQSDSMLLSLDLKSIAVSNGSACTSGTVEPSHVLKAMGASQKRGMSAIRFSFGRHSKLEEIDVVVNALDEIVTRLRKIKRK